MQCDKEIHIYFNIILITMHYPALLTGYWAIVFIIITYLSRNEIQTAVSIL